MISLKNGDGITWPQGKRIAVMITFDFDAELLRYSVIGKEKTSFADVSRGQYGPDEGLERCLKMLRGQQLKTTFFVPGVIAERYPEAVRSIIADGHEIGYHGYEHAATIGLSRAQEEANMAKSEAILEKMYGKRLLGHRAPLDILQECSLELMQERGYLYSSVLKDCDWAYIHEECDPATPVVELPTEPTLDDFTFFYFSYADDKTITGNYPAQYVYEIWQDYFDELAEEQDKVMVLKLHPQLIGRSSRIRMVDRLITYMKANGAWVASCQEVATYVKDYYAAKEKREGGDQ